MRKIKNSELNRLSVEGFKAAKKSPLIVILDNVRSLNNVGSIFRSADAFRIQHIYLCGITATPPHKDIQKTALGSTEAVDWSYAKDTLAVVEKLQSVNVKVMAIEQAENATVLQDFYPNNQSIYALVFGHEVKGVNQASGTPNGIRMSMTTGDVNGTCEKIVDILDLIKSSFFSTYAIRMRTLLISKPHN